MLSRRRLECLQKCVNSEKLIEVVDRQFIVALDDVVRGYPTVTSAGVNVLCEVAGHLVSLAFEGDLADLDIAEAVREGLATLSELLSADSFTCSYVTEQAYQALETLGERADVLVAQLFFTLCRIEDARKSCDMVGSGRGRMAKLRETAVTEMMKSYNAVSAVAIWALELLRQVVSHRPLCARDIWEWACGDPFSIFILVRDLLMWDGTNNLDHERLPHGVGQLQSAVRIAVFGLASPDVAFSVSDTSADDDVDIASRNAFLLMHHAFLATAAVDCEFVSVIVAQLRPSVITDGSECTDWNLLTRVTRLLSLLVEPARTLGAPPPQACDATSRFRESLSLHCTILWASLTSIATIPMHGAHLHEFLRDCATLAYAAPPNGDRFSEFLRCCLLASSKNVPKSSQMLAALVVCAANIGLIPQPNKDLEVVLLAAVAETRASVVLELGGWRGPFRAEALEPWRCFIASSLDGAEPSAPSVEATDITNCETASTGGLFHKHLEGNRHGGLRELLHDVPPEFCCALDGRLLLDPVRSPHGHVFERSVLERSLGDSGGYCPLSGMPLTVEDCPRYTELRLRLVRWVRESRTQRF